MLGSREERGSWLEAMSSSGPEQRDKSRQSTDIQSHRGQRADSFITTVIHSITLDLRKSRIYGHTVGMLLLTYSEFSFSLFLILSHTLFLPLSLLLCVSLSLSLSLSYQPLIMTLCIKHWDSKCHLTSAIKTVTPLSQTQHVRCQ